MNERKYPLVNQERDPRFVSLRSLQTAPGRTRTGLFIIEGLRHLARAVEQHARIESVFYDPSTLSNLYGRKLIKQLSRSGIPGVRLSHELYRALTLAAEPQGIGAVLRQQWVAMNSLCAGRDSFWLGVESIESPGNLGTILRTAEAAGINGIFLIGPCCDPYDPAAVRASMGALFAQKLIRSSANEIRHWARSNEVAIVGSSSTGLLDYKTLRYRWPAVLLMGSEKQGLSQQLKEITDYMVRIPMRGGGNSINVSVAAGVLLFEMASHRPRT